MAGSSYPHYYQGAFYVKITNTGNMFWDAVSRLVFASTPIPDWDIEAWVTAANDRCVVLALRPSVRDPRLFQANTFVAIDVSEDILDDIGRVVTISRQSEIGLHDIQTLATGEATDAVIVCMKKVLAHQITVYLTTVEGGQRRMTVFSKSFWVGRDNYGQPNLLSADEESALFETIGSRRLANAIEPGFQFATPVVEPQGLFDAEIRVLAASDSNPTPQSASELSFSGRWMYMEQRTNCEPDVSQGGATDAKFRCRVRNQWRPLSRARLDFYRIRNGQWTFLFSATTGDDGRYLVITNYGWQQGDTFVSRIFLEYREGYPYGCGCTRFRVLANGAPLYAQTNEFAPMADGVVDFGTWGITGGAGAQIYATAQEAIALWAGVVAGFQDLDVNWWVGPLQGCWPATNSRYLISLCQPGAGATWVWRDGNVLAHEMGHVMHLHAWEGHLQFNYYYPEQQCGPPQQCPQAGHSWNSDEWQEASFVEGFANFAAAGTFYGPASDDPLFFGYRLSDPPAGGAPVCVQSPTGQPHRAEGNVSRFLWDVYDSINDDFYRDGMNQTIYWIWGNLDVFAPGTGNRQRDELSLDGPNVWDYYWMCTYYGPSPRIGPVNEI